MRYTMSGIIPQKLTLNFLIDELQEGEKLIDITLPVYSKFTDDEELREIMYNAVVANYCWSELGFETADQFKMWFQTYWNRVLFKYLNDLRNQIMIGENLITARIETAHTDDETTEKPEFTDTTTDTYGETNEITHGHVLQHNRELTEDFAQGVTVTEETERTQYETQTVTDSVTTTPTGKNETALGGQYTNTNSGTDKTERGGTNTHTLERTGQRIITLKNDRTNNVQYYDYDKLVTALEASNSLDAFIDEFAPLFAEVIYFE